MLDKSQSVPLSTHEELAKFDQLAKNWWDPNGQFKHVISFNQARFKSMFNRVIDIFQCDINTPLPLAKLRVLDLGCGGGLLSEAFARQGANVTGVDGSEMSIEIAKTHAKQSGLDIDYRYGLIEDMAFEQKFDVVINAEVIEHVVNQGQLVSHCCQQLEKDGLLIIATLNRNWLSYLVAIIGAEYLLKMLPKGTHDWRFFVTPKQLAQWVSGDDKRIIDIHGINFTPILNRWREGDAARVNYISYIQ